MAEKKTTAVVVESAAKGGVGAVMPYVAIGVIGYLGLKHLKEMDVDVGGAAGQIIESFTEGISETVTEVIDRTSETVIHIKETVIETADVRVEPLGKTMIKGEPLAFGEFLKETRKGETMLPWYTGVLATVGHYGTGGLLTEPFIEAGRKTRKILPESIRETMDVRVYGAAPKPTKSQKVVTGYQEYVSAGGTRAPYAPKSTKSQKVVTGYQEYVSAGGTRAPYAPKPTKTEKEIVETVKASGYHAATPPSLRK